MTRLRTGRRRTAATTAAVFALFLVAAGALAYWTTFGLGSAAAASSGFPPPAGVVATFPNPAVRTVHVAWTPSPAPNGGNPDGYYVVRLSGSTPSPACASSPTSLLAAASTACADTAVPSGTYTYVVTAVFRSWTAAGAPSPAVTVPNPALASYAVVPSTTTPTAGTGFTLTITAYDQYGAILTSYTGTRCVTLSGPHVSPGGTSPTYPTAGACGSGSSLTFASGVASAVPVTLFDAKTTTITATDTAAAKSGTTATITVAAASAAKLAFTQQPSNGLQNTALGVQPVVAIQDAYGNTVTTNTSPVALTVSGGAALACTTNPLAASGGLAAFSGCRVNLAGTFTLSATDSPLTAATSASFTISAGVAYSLTYVSGAGQVATVATPFGAPLVVLVKDKNGVALSGATVTFTAPVSGASGTFNGGVTTATAVSAANGQATSPAYTANTVAGTDTVTVTVTGGGNGTTVYSVTIALTNAPGPAVRLAFVQQPSGTTAAGSAFATQPRVAVQDAYGNTATSDTSQVMLTAAGSGLACTTNPLAALAGVATFAGCTATKTGTWTLTATDGTLTSATSASFTITAAAPAVVSVSSGAGQSTTVATAFTSALVALVSDAYGNAVPGATVTFTAASPGPSATFSGSLTASATASASGLATSPVPVANTIAGSHTVIASVSGATSASFALTNTPGSPAKLAFVQQPSGGVAGTAFATQPKIAVQDAYGNTVTGNTSQVTLAVTGGGATVSCAANPQAASSGVASFGGCSMTKAGTWTLTATGGTLTAATSASFTISAGAAASIAISSGSNQTATVNSAFAGPLVALVADAYGNPVSGAGVTFTPDQTAAASGTFAGNAATTTVATGSNGLATTSSFTANTVAGTYTVTADAGLASSAIFTLTNAPGAPTQLGFTAQPGNSSPNLAFASQPQVGVVDAYGNVVSTASASITLAITSGTGTSGAALTCSANPLATSSGVASFGGCAINLAGTNYTLTATGGYAAATSLAITITQSLTPSSLTFTNSGASGVPNAGDTMAVTFSGTLRAATMCSDWTSDTSAYSVSGAITIIDGGAGNDSISVSTAGACGGAFKFGSVDLGTRRYTKLGNATYGATISWDPSARRLTVTLGSLTAGTAPTGFKGAPTATYYPSASLQDPNGGAITGTATSGVRIF